jgi:parallel beta-helix repeat protein
MKTKSITSKLTSTLGAILALCASPSLNAQGPLAPPGAPSPLFKTLEQVEPRRPISSVPFNITQPGSYYLTTNLVGIAAQNGITINSDCVTIDLMGFELRGVPGSLSGIFFNGQFRAYIYNGCFRNWGQDGINGNNGAASILERLRVGNNGRNGIAINSGSQVRQCIVSASGQVGILTSNDVEVDDCVSGGNTTHGIQVGTGSNVRRCLTSGNGASGITGSGLNGLNISDCNADNNGAGGIAGIGQTIVKDCFTRSNRTVGITVGDGSSVINSTANDNGVPTVTVANGINVGGGSTVRDCTTRNNTGDGITASFGCTVVNNSCRDNFGDNIEVSQECLVAENACDDDSAVANRGQSGIRVVGNNNRIDNNTVTETVRGLWITSPDNEVLNNTVLRNSTNYVIVPGNQLSIRLGQIPETIPWPANVELAGTLRGVAGQNGITITTNDVTIDLKGHALVGVAGSLDGILVSGSRTNIVVRNGTIRGWGSDGVQASASYNSSFSELRVSNNGANGLQGGNGAVIKSVTARANRGIGITTSTGCTITESASSENILDGIVASSGSTVSGSSAYNNGRTGISASTGSTVVNCSAYSNTNGISASSGSTVTSCTATANATNGIIAAFGATITGCTARDNRTGINVGDDSRVTNNTCDQNALTAGDVGILVTGSDNRIDGNHVSDNSIGIDVNGTGNLIVRNTAAGNTTPYSIVAGNNSAAIVASPGLNFASTAPWANFSF